MRKYSTAFSAVFLLILSPLSIGAEFQTGQEAYSIGDYQVALAEWQPLAEEGDAGSQFGLGLLYANGFGVEFDNDQALKWYQLAADQGHGEAQCNLAVMHANGWGVPQNDAEAFKYYNLAAEQGITQAQISLAKMYASGLGVAQDKVQAYKWYAIAAELDGYGASFKRDDLASSMSADEIAQSDELVSVWMASNEHMLANE